MFHNSTQRKQWMFKDKQELLQIRESTNQAFCQKYAKVAAEKGCVFLSAEDEMVVCQYYMKKLLEFCNLFTPPVPRSALATAAAYLKRFFLHCSVIEFHPRDIFLCCVYIAFKVDEYNVSIEQFVHVLTPQLRSTVAEFVLGHELLLLKKLHFHLTVHSPFRPLEGFIIDMKTRTPNIPNPDHFRAAAESFLVKSLSSDVAFLYPPSQIALSSLWYSAKQTPNQIDGYIMSMLLHSESPDTTHKIMETLQRIEDMVVTSTLPDGATVAPLETKLERCRLKELSPKSRKRKSEEKGGGASAEKRLKINKEETPLPPYGISTVQQT